MKPTPGPWTTIWGGAYVVRESDKNKKLGGSIIPERWSEYAAVIATIGGIQDREPFIPKDEAVANARLIASCPAMLAALTAAEPILRAYIPADQFDGHAAEALRLVSAALAAAR